MGGFRHRAILAVFHHAHNRDPGPFPFPRILPPTGLPPAKNRCAKVWFTIATGAVAGVSCSVKSRPIKSGIPRRRSTPARLERCRRGCPPAAGRIAFDLQFDEALLPNASGMSRL